MQIEPLLYETHCHTPLCKHAVGEPEEYAAVAEARGLRGVIVTCHNPLPEGHSAHVRMAVEELGVYVDMVARAREAWSGRVDVRLGIEADYWPGFEGWLAGQLESAEFHYVLGSVHPQTPEYRRTYAAADPLEAQRNYFSMLADAAESGLFDSLSHPDLIKNETAAAWRPDEIMNDLRRVLDRIARTGVAMELNTSGADKVIAEMNPFPQMLIEMCARGIPVTLGADAHVPTRVADRFPEALKLLSSCGYESVSVFLDRRRREIPIEDALESLRIVNEPDAKSRASASP
ncbi:MAG: histidinol-phosphatase HisJ family protein [Planctomycetaceae bacterium]